MSMNQDTNLWRIHLRFIAWIPGKLTTKSLQRFLDAAP